MKRIRLSGLFVMALMGGVCTAAMQIDPGLLGKGPVVLPYAKALEDIAKLAQMPAGSYGLDAIAQAEVVHKDLQDTNVKKASAVVAAIAALPVSSQWLVKVVGNSSVNRRLKNIANDSFGRSGGNEASTYIVQDAMALLKLPISPLRLEAISIAQNMNTRKSRWQSNPEFKLIFRSINQAMPELYRKLIVSVANAAVVTALTNIVQLSYTSLSLSDPAAVNLARTLKNIDLKVKGVADDPSVKAALKGAIKSFLDSVPELDT